MRIVFLSPSLGDAYGQEKILEREVRFLRETGHSVYLVGDKILGTPPPCDEMVAIPGISSVHSLSTPFHFRKMEKTLLEHLKKLAPDVVHLIDQVDARLMRSLAKKFPTVLTAHTVAPTCPSSQRFFSKEGGVCEKKSGWRCLKQSQSAGCLSHFKTPLHQTHALIEYKLKRKSLSLFSGIGAISPYLEKVLIKDGFPKNQVFPLYNFIEKDPRSNTNRKVSPPLLLVVARLVPLKGIDTLLDNFQSLKQRDWNCWIYGDGPQKSYLQDLTIRFGLQDRVQFKGKCPSQEIKDSLQKASLFIQPNRGPEGFGLAVAEAISQGVPVLAYDVPALNDLIKNGVNGFLVPLHPKLGLARAIEKILSQPDCLNSLSQSSRPFHEDLFSNYSWENHCRSLLAFYEKAQENFKGKS